MNIETFLINYLPKDEKIINGIICQMCKDRFYLKDYKSKNNLKIYMISHMLHHLKLKRGIQITQNIIDKVKEKLKK